MKNAEREAAGRLLNQLLKERHISKAEFARQIKREPHNVYRWCSGKEFDLKNQQQAARGLGLAEDHFSQPDETKKRELETQREFAAFLRRPYAKRLTQAQIAVIKSLRFVDATVRPSVALYEALASVLLRDIPEHAAMQVAETNDAIDRTAVLGVPLRRRKRPVK